MLSSLFFRSMLQGKTCLFCVILKLWWNSMKWWMLQKVGSIFYIFLLSWRMLRLECFIEGIRFINLTIAFFGSKPFFEWNSPSLDDCISTPINKRGTNKKIIGVYLIGKSYSKKSWFVIDNFISLSRILALIQCFLPWVI